MGEWLHCKICDMSVTNQKVMDEHHKHEYYLKRISELKAVNDGSLDKAPG